MPETIPPMLESAVLADRRPWPILVVDDDPDVHEATEFALQDVEFFGRPVELWHAYSASEALDLLKGTPEPAVVLLDVVMETEDAGLQLVTRIRGELALHRPRIILRTGQPGHAPELDAVSLYDINDYKTKSELTRNKLCTTVIAALRSYDQLRRVDASRVALESIIKSSQWFLADEARDSFAEGVLTQIAHFIGIEPEGVICARADGTGGVNGNDYVIVAAAGRCRDFMSKRLGDVPDKEIVDALTGCFQQRRTVIHARSLTLHFAGQTAEDDFAAYIASDRPLREVDEHLLEVFRNNVAVCGRNVELMQLLKDYAYRDQQVDLPNRRAFIDAIERRRVDVPIGRSVVALLDIDDFSNTDDLMGHHFGDLLLGAMAHRLRAGLPADCFVARVADDKFGIVGLYDSIKPERLHELVDPPFSVEGVLHSVTVCIGLADLELDARSGVEHLKDVQIALKRAKSIGQGQSMYYSRAIGLEMRERSRMVQDIRRAFDGSRLNTVYQPLVDLKTGKVVGVESLMRWWLDERTAVPPDKFIQVAEQSGLMLALGLWSLRTSLATLCELDKAGFAGLRMSVNVSVVQFRQLDFVATVAQALKDFGVSADRLELEVTESAAMLGLDQVIAMLTELGSMGVTIALDDFGTGFSSLSYLHRLPIDRLKIDRSFVQTVCTQEPGSRIARTVLHLGVQLGVPVLAEGIEDQAQADLLRSLGCEEAQGYHFARPMAVEDLIKWLAQRQLS